MHYLMMCTYMHKHAKMAQEQADQAQAIPEVLPYTNACKPLSCFAVTNLVTRLAQPGVPLQLHWMCLAGD